MKLEVLEHTPKTNSEHPPLLFIHGASHGAWCWREHFLPYFAAKGFPSYALSFRGHGESEGRERLHTFTLADYTEDVLNVIKGLKSKPVLIGHSMGGAVVQKIMHTFPDQIRSMVLMASSPPSGMGKEWAKIVLTRFRLVYKMYLFNKGKSTVFPEKLLFSDALGPAKKREYLSRLQPESMKAAEEMIRQALDTKALKTKMPVLVLGSSKDEFFSDKIAIKIARAYQTEPVIFPDVSHDMMLDPKWETVAESLLRFFYETAS